MVFVHKHISYGDAWLLLTAGGHVDFGSGLEIVINAARARGKRVLASANGWEGVSRSPPVIYDITEYPIKHLRHFGGSPFGSSRTNPIKGGLIPVLLDNIKKYGEVVIVAYGGEDTLGVANYLYQQHSLPIVGWPKTMDNDSKGHHATIGYQTAVSRAAQGTREAYDNAATNGKIVLVPVFGRKFDWVAGGAADYGFADYVIPAEKKGMTLEQVAKDIKEVKEKNREMYGMPFAVVVVSEAATGLEGLWHYLVRHLPAKELERDNFDHEKFEPEALSLAMKEGLTEMGINPKIISSKILTYHLRDGKLDPLDERFAISTAEECVRLIDFQQFGRSAAIQHPRYSSAWPDAGEQYKWIKGADGTKLFVSSVPLEIAAQTKPVADTPFFDYDALRPTAQMSEFLATLLGPKPVNPRDKIVPLRLAVPVNLDLRVEEAEAEQRTLL